MHPTIEMQAWRPLALGCMNRYPLACMDAATFSNHMQLQRQQSDKPPCHWYSSTCMHVMECMKLQTIVIWSIYQTWRTSFLVPKELQTASPRLLWVWAVKHIYFHMHIYFTQWLTCTYMYMTCAQITHNCSRTHNHITCSKTMQLFSYPRYQKFDKNARTFMHVLDRLTYV